MTISKMNFFLFAGLALLVVLVGSCEGRGPLIKSFPPGRLPHAGSKSGATSEQRTAEFRIPDALVPTHYKIQLLPVFDDPEVTDPVGEPWNVYGNVEITLECRQTTNEIHLHAWDLANVMNNPDIQVFPVGNNLPVIPITSRTNHTQDPEVIVFSLESQLTPGNQYVIYIPNYKGNIPDHKGFGGRMNGMYRTTYEDESDPPVVKTIATTQFSKTRGFRKLVPSFDDPKFKAKFTISIARHDTYRSLSCMNRVNGEQDDPVGDDFPNWYWDHYATTPVMPPTVTAMVVYKDGDLTGHPATSTGLDTTVNVWGPPHIITGQQAIFSAQAVADLLAYYNTHFGIDYELPKMDSLGINHFYSGAMENWGLNIYRAAYMFHHPEHGTEALKFSTGRVVAHELAHQWWGNLVTHQWWNDWWLTEGFGTYFSYEAFNAVYSPYAAKVRGITDEHQDALAFDITPASKPVHGKAEDTLEINPSAIDYSKGSSLVRMMSAFLTEPVFTKGIKGYLEKRRYQAVSQDELFADLQESLEVEEQPSNGKSIAEIMDAWTKNTAYPVVRVSKSESTPNLVYFSQERFEAFEEQAPEDAGESWYIPIMIVSQAVPVSDKRTPDLWLNQGISLTTHSVRNSDDWILVNPEARGYYRVLYDDHYARLLQFQLTYALETIPEASRSQLIDDYLTFAFEQYIRFDEADKMVGFISRDNMLGSWISYLRHFRRAYDLLREPATGDYDRFKAYVLPKVEGGLAVIGLAGDNPGDSIQTHILRSQLMDWACAMGDAECTAYADELFESWMTSGIPIPVELRSVVYCRGAATDGTLEGDKQHWDFLRSKYAETGDVQLRSALSCSSNTFSLDSLLLEAEGSTDPDEGWALLEVVAISDKDHRAKVIGSLTAKMPTYNENLGIEGLLDVFDAMTPLVHDTTEIDSIQVIVDTWIDESIFTEDVLGKLNSAISTMRSNTAWLPKFRDRFLVNFPEVQAANPAFCEV